jgi:chemotaxis protein methyltransferase CheR
LSDQEFAQFQELLFDIAGIYLAPAKKIMLAGRLQRRIRLHKLHSFGDYFQLLQQRKEELQVAVDLLTTNETYFFREPRHFEFLEKSILPSHPQGQPFRIWSAASSSGEEAYSLAMLMADRLGASCSWEVLASDISMQVLEKAQRGIYPLRRAELIPLAYKQRYCLRGVDEQEGMLLVNQALRQRVRFRQVNLNNTLPNDLGVFDLILLRNVMIYFQLETKREVVRRIVKQLKPGAYLFIGHSESLHGFEGGLQLVQPSVYRKPA